MAGEGSGDREQGTLLFPLTRSSLSGKRLGPAALDELDPILIWLLTNVELRGERMLRAYVQELLATGSPRTALESDGVRLRQNCQSKTSRTMATAHHPTV